jgi:hypothetical protein
MVDPSKEMEPISAVLSEIMKSAPGVKGYFVEPDSGQL